MTDTVNPHRSTPLRREGLPPGEARLAALLIDFSQGTRLLAEHLVRRPRPYAAVALLTGGHLGPDEARTPVDGLQAVRALPDSAGR
jgi:hypothetical protein